MTKKSTYEMLPQRVKDVIGEEEYINQKLYEIRLRDLPLATIIFIKELHEKFSNLRKERDEQRAECKELQEELEGYYYAFESMEEIIKCLKKDKSFWLES